MPGISVDLQEVNRATQIHAKASASGARVKEKVFSRLIFFGWQNAVSERAEIRAIRPPEPYKGKGIRYADEKIVIKETKKK